MCAIAGLACTAGSAPPAGALASMLDAMAHRGPDGQGTAESAHVSIGHRRLAVIDPEGGAQPIRAGGAMFAANAEIYNYPELRALLPPGQCTTGGDCEPALHLFRREGSAFVKRLRGMYGLVAHDTDTETVLLARDPFGIKPLYFVQAPWGVAFASEPRALLAAGLAPRTISPRARAALLGMQFCPGAETIYPAITRVLPGESVHIERGVMTGRSFLHPLPPGRPKPLHPRLALENLDRALTESVGVHLRADVPAGLLLSGGIDSAAILAVMARHTKVQAFTAGFDVPGAPDEREKAARVAAAVGARHETITVTQADFMRFLPEIVACMDDPAADYAAIPLWKLARHVRGSLKVLLSGEGGDELFAGYGRYRRAVRQWWRGGRRMRNRNVLAGLGVLRDTGPLWRAGWSAAEAAAARPYRTRLQAAQAADIGEWLPNDLLTKLDRCLMAHGLEGRTPLLDPAIVAAAWRLPDRLKTDGRRGKVLLRMWLAEALPAADAMAPKQGFTVPVGSWIGAAGRQLGKLVAALPCIDEIAYPARVQRIFESPRHGSAAWTLLFYALWHRAHIETHPMDGSLLDVLAAK
jgi:asparagine synthase (glutamine-hydrolysing)